MNDVLSHIAAAAEARHAMQESETREDSLKAEIKRIEAAIKEEHEARARSGVAHDQAVAKIAAAGIREEDAGALVEAQLNVLVALSAARSNATRHKISRPKAEQMQIRIAREQGVDAGRIARISGSIEDVANPWAAGSAEADAFVEGLHAGFEDAEEAGAAAAGTPAKPAPSLDNVDQDIRIGIAQADDSDPFGPDDPDIKSLAADGDLEVSVAAGRDRGRADEPF